MFGSLLRFRLRRDRTQLIVWGLALLLLTLLVVRDVKDTFATTAERANTLRVLLVTPAVLMFRGRPQGTSEGDFVAVLGIAFIALLVAMMSTFLVVRHTRAEEERGRLEMLSATAAGRLAPSLAVLALGVLANGVATVAIAAGCLIGGLPAGGSWLLAAACGTTGLAFVGIAFALAQVFPTSRAANSWAAALAVIAYFVRGIGDAAGTPHPATYSLTPAWPSWLSPIGWAQATLPFAENRVWPLLLGLGTFVVLAAVGLALQERRDLGAGLVAERRSRSTAPATLLGSFGLALRLERWGLIGWLVGLVALAGLLGALSGVVVHQLNDAGPGVANAIDAIGGSNGTLSQAFANLGAGFSGLLAAAICVQGAQRLRQEEAAGSADTALATATGRVRWMLSFLGVAAVGAVLSLLLGGLVAGASAGDSGIGFGTWLAAYLWEVPAVLVFLGIGAVLFAVWPRGAIATGWLLFALAAFLGLFGPLVGVPEWARRLAPFAHTPAVALPDPSYVGGVVMSVLAAALLAAGVVLFRLRDTRPVG